MPIAEIAGRRLYYESRHPLTGPTPGARILFLHGSGVDHRLFDEQLRFFSVAHTPIALDLPGHGRSDGEALETVKGCREIVEAFVRALKLAPIVLCGHALGGAIAVEYTAKRPREVEGIVLIDTGVTFPTAADDATEFARDPTAYRKRRLRRGLTDRTPEFVAEKLMAARQETSDRSYLRDLRASAEWDGSTRLTQVHVPALIVYGEDDPLLSQAGAMLEAMPQASFDTVPLARHFPQLEMPDIFNDSLNRFLTVLPDIAIAGGE